MASAWEIRQQREEERERRLRSKAQELIRQLAPAFGNDLAPLKRQFEELSNLAIHGKTAVREWCKARGLRYTPLYGNKPLLDTVISEISKRMGI